MVGHLKGHVRILLNKMMVTPRRLISRIIVKISRTMIGDNPREGSSRNSNLGRFMRARAMAGIYCTPPESVPASCKVRSRSTGIWPDRINMCRFQTFQTNIKNHTSLQFQDHRGPA